MTRNLPGRAKSCHPVFQRLLACFLFCAALCGLCALSAQAGGKPEKMIHTFDLTYTLRLDARDPAARRRIWDETHFVTSVQGIVNRHRPRLYVYLESLSYVRMGSDCLFAPAVQTSNSRTSPDCGGCGRIVRAKVI